MVSRRTGTHCPDGMARAGVGEASAGSGAALAEPGDREALPSFFAQLERVATTNATSNELINFIVIEPAFATSLSKSMFSLARVSSAPSESRCHEAKCREYPPPAVRRIPAGLQN